MLFIVYSFFIFSLDTHCFEVIFKPNYLKMDLAKPRVKPPITVGREPLNV